MTSDHYVLDDQGPRSAVLDPEVLRSGSGSGEVHLDVRDLGKRYGADTTWAVRGSSFAVHKGEFFGLLGPSGCGKSTTLNVIAGFAEPTEGEITLDGRSLKGVDAHRRGIGMVFQDYALFPHLSAADNVAFGLRLRRLSRGRIRARVGEMLDLVGLANKGHHLPKHLSGGEQQRIALARALAVEPVVVLLDEPLSNLDARLRETMRRELRRILTEADVTAIFVTHDQSEAFAMCDRVAVMFDGRIQQVGRPYEIYKSPATVRVARFVGEGTWVPAELVAGGGGAASARCRLGGQEVDVRCRLAADATPGAVGLVLLRPEVLALAPQRSASGALTGHISGRVFLGPVTGYDIAVGDATIWVTELSHRPMLDVGSPVSVTVAEGEASFFPEG